MKDDFLHQFREKPDNQFAEKLHQQLFEEVNMVSEITISKVEVSLNGHSASNRPLRKPQWVTLAAAIFALLILGSMVILSRVGLHTDDQTFTSPLEHLQIISTDNASKLTQVFQLGRGLISQVRWSPDGKKLAVSGAQGVWLHDGANLNAPPELLPAEVPADAPGVTFKDGSPYATDIPAAARAIAFSPNGEFLTMADGGHVRIWNLDSRQVVADIDARTSLVRAVAFSPDGKFLATGGGKQDDDPVNFVIRLWDTTTWEEALNIGDQTSPISNVAFSPDNQILASENRDGAYLWDAANGQLIHALRWRSNQPTLSGMAFSPDGKTFALADSPTASLWDVETGKRIDSIDFTELVTPSENGSPFQFPASIFPDIKDLTFSPNGRLLAIESSVLGLVLWDTQTKQFLTEKHAPQQILYQSANLSFSAAFSPDGERLASVEYSGSVNLMNVETSTVQPVDGYIGAMFGFTRVSSDSKQLAFSEYERWGISFYDLPSGSKTRQLAIDNPNYPLDMSTNWDWLVSTDAVPQDDSWKRIDIKFMDTITGKTLATAEGERNGPQIGVFSADNHYFATATQDMNGKTATIRLWDITQFPILSNPITYQYTKGTIMDAVFNPDHTVLAIGTRVGDWGSKQGELLLMNVASGEVHSVLSYPDGSLNQLHFTPDGNTLVAATETGIVVFDLLNRSVIDHFDQRDEDVAHSNFSPNGSLLAATQDDTLYLWNIETGEILFSHPLTKGIDFQTNADVLVSPDGRFIVTAGYDGKINIWGAPSP